MRVVASMHPPNGTAARRVRQAPRNGVTDALRESRPDGATRSTAAPCPASVGHRSIIRRSRLDAKPLVSTVMFGENRTLAITHPVKLNSGPRQNRRQKRSDGNWPFAEM